MPKLDRELLYRQLDNYQIQRHDFLNNFQVIRGYIQLEMPQKAMEYIDEVIDGLHYQQQLYKISQKSMQAILICLFFDLRLKGVLMELSFSPEMQGEVFWEKHWQEEYAQQFYGYTKECSSLIPINEDPDKLLVKIELRTYDESFQCGFVLFKGEEVCAHKVFTAGG